MEFINRLRTYVRLLIGMGVHIRPGERLLIWCPTDAAHVARLAMEEAYHAGAADVAIRWGDDQTDRMQCLLAPESHFREMAAREETQARHWSDRGYKTLWLYAANPELFKSVDPERAQAFQSVMPPTSWTLACVATPAWARVVFPQLSDEEEALRLMWEAIFRACRVDDQDTAHNWQLHMNNLRERANSLRACLPSLHTRHFAHLSPPFRLVVLACRETGGVLRAENSAKSMRKHGRTEMVNRLLRLAASHAFASKTQGGQTWR